VVEVAEGCALKVQIGESLGRAARAATAAVV
jgi:hypothetical protein